MAPLFETPLSAWHIAHGAKMLPFAGWNMPIQYPDGIISEHLHTREKAGLFDISHMGEFILDGSGAAKSLGRALTVNIATLKPGRCRYGFLLNAEGGIMDDLIVYRMADERFMIVVNAGCREADYAAIKERVYAGQGGPHLEDISEATAKLDLQGPQSFAVLEALLPGSHWRRIPYFGFTQEAVFDGAPLLVSRTGYTGELGAEIYCPTNKALKLWELLLTDARVKPVGLGARDTLRLEVGLPLYGQDLDEQHTPAEAGYAAMLTSQEPYVGKEKSYTVRQKLTPLVIPGRRSARRGDAVLLNGIDVGVVTSGSFGPSVGSAVALAYIDTEHAAAPAYTVSAAKVGLEALAAELPFYKGGTARMALV